MAARGIFERDGFVTSEAVEIDLPPATLPLRIASGAIDLIIVFVLLALIVWIAPWSLVGSDLALLQALVILIVVSAFVAVPVTQETLTRGRTVGKLALGLRTVRDDTGPIGFRHALIRGLTGWVEIWLTLGGVAVLVAATNDKGKRLGDLLAGTYVVRDRSRLQLPPPPAMPDLLMGWAQDTDIGVVPDALAVAVRQFLARSGDLTPPARAATGTALYADLMRHVAPPPPQGAHPEAVMSAVMAERRRRDMIRLDRQDRLRARVLGPDPLAR
ncbi:RDD family protein [Ornithinicoccus hortensis]|uniref:Putative RDD family membrane protein YckC n=1 Tax=Ornithinicoccus hortensis TaxID=82346 RepID=A0A542YQ85_9MICO|nr:RDD family protein [Ornithinicoccus hortensis]TQL50262.1 putative RDD family membrane protein YckC [Ornithinicoccus hortensis]